MAEETSTAQEGTAQEQGGQSVRPPTTPRTGVGAGTNLPADQTTDRQPAASTAAPAGAQEDASQPAAPAQESGGISEAERLRRLQQGLVDKAVARALAEFARLEQQRAQQQRVADMDDAELGAEVRRQKELAEYAEAVRARDLAVLREQTLAIVEDERAREALAEQERAGTFRSYAEFLRAAVEAQLGAEEPKLRSRLEREIREALTKELVANESAGGPQLGSGNAPSTLTLAMIKRMSPAEINERWDEVQAVLSAGKT